MDNLIITQYDPGCNLLAPLLNRRTDFIPTYPRTTKAAANTDIITIFIGTAVITAGGAS
jgi:hypothetical protein